MTSPEPILFCWSGGKDSAMALHTLFQQKTFQVVALLTTVTETYDRIAMHGVRRELLKRQAESIGLPLHEVFIPPQCVNPVYEARMEEALRIHLAQGVRKVAFGDIFLEDLRAYREKNLAHIGMTALFPIWKRDTRELIEHFHRHHFRAIAACVDAKVLDASFAGRELVESLFRDLPSHVDPCGENGEFHTFVFDGPIFQTPIPIRTGEVVNRDGFVFCDLLPADLDMCPAIPSFRAKREISLRWLLQRPQMIQQGGISMNENAINTPRLLYRTLFAVALIMLAASLRIAPHPWNFTPLGAMALFSGALLKDRRLAFTFPLVALFVGDVFIGFHKLLPIVYASFLINVAIGLWLRDRRSIARISLATFLGAIQFFLVTNFAVWWLLNSYPKTASGLAACYLAGIPFFWNTLAGDAFYAVLLFGAYALAERFVPALRPFAQRASA